MKYGETSKDRIRMHMWGPVPKAISSSIINYKIKHKIKY